MQNLQWWYQFGFDVNIHAASPSREFENAVNAKANR